MDISYNIKEINDQRLINVMQLLQEAPIENLKNFLDIGMGQGEILKWLSKQGKKCTGTGLQIKSYGIDQNKLKKEYDIDIFECSAEKMPFKNKHFDGIIMSHVLEHCPDVRIVLREVRRVLSDKGWLFIFVPPYDDIIYAGHISVGWNIGQLMYVLLINGFNVSHGHFIKYNFNVCGFVQKEHRTLPPLRGDKGDINTLFTKNFFPLSILTSNGENDTYFGNLNSINWNNNSEILKKLKIPAKPSSKLFYFLFYPILAAFNLMPFKIKLRISDRIMRIANILRITTFHNFELFNPKNLKGL